MNNFWKWILNFIILLSLLSCAKEDLDANLRIEIDPRIEKYYKEDYLSSRDAFLEIAKKFSSKFKLTQIGKISIPSKDKSLEYRVDYIFIPAQRVVEKTFILTSGIHGIEAFTGAAMQRHFLEEIYEKYVNLQNTNTLVIHALNPWGFHNLRRVTENNIDLNRNFGLTKDLFNKKNEGYRAIHELLNPNSPADTGFLQDKLFIVKAIYNIATKGMPALRQAILEGQYEIPKGIYFGGQEFEPLRYPLDELLVKATLSSKKILFIDLHTGYGERGVLHLFPSDPKNEKVKKLTEEVFTGYKIDWASSDDFYKTTGELSTHVCDLVAENVDCIPMVFEYGTLNSQTTLGSIESIHRTILENQGYWEGYASKEAEKRIKEKYREMFFPSSKKWRTKVLLDTEKIWGNVFKNF